MARTAPTLYGPREAPVVDPGSPVSTRLWHQERKHQWRGLDQDGRQVFVHYDYPRPYDYSVLGSDGAKPFAYLDGEARDEVVEDLIAWLAANGREIPEARA